MRKYQIEKVANAIIMAIDMGVENLGKTKLMKLLFFADKYHLKEYGKPIFFDRYIKEKMGPVALKTYSILSSINDSEKEDFKDEIDKLLEWIDVEEKDVNKTYPMLTFKKKKEFCKDYFSKSELSILEKVFKEFKYFTAQMISEYSHLLKEYKNKSISDDISYEEMAEEMGDYVKFWEEERIAFEKSLR